MSLALPARVNSGSLDEVRRELSEAIAAKKCHPCGCFHDTVAAAEGIDGARAALGELLAAARAKLEPRRYDCLGCDPCWPAAAANALAEAFPGALPSGVSCGAEAPAPRTGWPPLAGDYRVVRFRAPVALCALGSPELARAIGEAAPDGLSIAGSLATENLGIERIVRNVVANPNIRFLVLCGEESRGAVGHLPGQSLRSLFANGVDEDGRIVGAKGRRPVLRNVDRREVERFRGQVECLDAIGETDAARVAALVAGAVSRDPGPLPEPSPFPSPYERIAGSPPRRLVPDPAGYFVIFVDGGSLAAEHYSVEGVLDLVVEAPTPEAVYGPILERGLLTRLDHAAYLGRELSRAEHAMRLGVRYVQDRAPGEIDDPKEGSCGCAPGACGGAA